MTDSACGCDDAKAWEARAIRAEADLALAKNLLRQTRERIDALMSALPPDPPAGDIWADPNKPPFADCYVVGQHPDGSPIWANGQVFFDEPGGEPR